MGQLGGDVGSVLESDAVNITAIRNAFETSGIGLVSSSSLCSRLSPKSVKRAPRHKNQTSSPRHGCGETYKARAAATKETIRARISQSRRPVAIDRRRSRGAAIGGHPCASLAELLLRLGGGGKAGRWGMPGTLQTRLRVGQNPERLPQNVFSTRPAACSSLRRSLDSSTAPLHVQQRCFQIRSLQRGAFSQHPPNYTPKTTAPPVKPAPAAVSNSFSPETSGLV